MTSNRKRCRRLLGAAFAVVEALLTRDGWARWRTAAGFAVDVSECETPSEVLLTRALAERRILEKGTLEVVARNAATLDYCARGGANRALPAARATTPPRVRLLEDQAAALFRDGRDADCAETCRSIHYDHDMRPQHAARVFLRQGRALVRLGRLEFATYCLEESLKRTKACRGLALVEVRWVAAGAHESIGDALSASCDHRRAIASYQTALELYLEGGGK